MRTDAGLAVNTWSVGENPWIHHRRVRSFADKGGVGAEQKAVVSNFDVNVGHVEVLLSPGGTKTLEVDPKSILGGLNKRDAGEVGTVPSGGPSHRQNLNVK